MTISQQNLLPHFDVSRETLDRLGKYEALLRKWSPQINLVSKSTLSQIWTRHFLDSAQVFAALDQSERRLIDLGAGGGFPGLVLAIMADAHQPDLRILLVESDVRKCAFLLTVVRELRLSAEVVTGRIEALDSLSADVVTARALAPLDQLCGFASLHMNVGGKALFLKGENHKQEVDLACGKWDFDLSTHPSLTNEAAALLEIKNLRSKI